MPITEPAAVPEQLFWYRLDDRSYASFDEFGDTDRVFHDVICHKYRVVKLTPCGAWLETGYSSTRWTSRKARKRFACPTVHEALESYIARKRKQAAILRSRAAIAETLMKQAELQYGRLLSKQEPV